MSITPENDTAEDAIIANWDPSPIDQLLGASDDLPRPLPAEAGTQGGDEASASVQPSYSPQLDDEIDIFNLTPDPLVLENDEIRQELSDARRRLDIRELMERNPSLRGQDKLLSAAAAMLKESGSAATVYEVGQLASSMLREVEDKMMVRHRVAGENRCAGIGGGSRPPGIRPLPKDPAGDDPNHYYKFIRKLQKSRGIY